jgi:hypothetical protein
MEEKQNGLGIAGFTISLISLLVLPLFLGALGLTFSSLGMSNETPKKGLATAGLIISIVSIVFGIFKGISMGVWY